VIFTAFLFAVLLGAFVFGVLPRGGYWQQILSVGLFLVLIAVVYGGVTEVLGRPKPASLEWRHVAEAEVLSARAVENKAIYLWLNFSDATEPRAYVLPWNQRVAEQLQAAERKAEEHGTGVRVRLPFNSVLDDSDRRFYATPQPSLPPKSAQTSAPIYLQP
jgi:hypothetical protein